MVIKVGDIKSAPPAVLIAPEGGSSLCLFKNCNKEDVFIFEASDTTTKQIARNFVKAAPSSTAQPRERAHRAVNCHGCLCLKTLRQQELRYQPRISTQHVRRCISSGQGNLGHWRHARPDQKSRRWISGSPPCHHQQSQHRASLGPQARHLVRPGQRGREGALRM